MCINICIHLPKFDIPMLIHTQCPYESQYKFLSKIHSNILIPISNQTFVPTQIPPFTNTHFHVNALSNLLSNTTQYLLDMLINP